MTKPAIFDLPSDGASLTTRQAAACVFIKGYMDMHFKHREAFTHEDYLVLKSKVMENLNVEL